MAYKLDYGDYPRFRATWRLASTKAYVDPDSVVFLAACYNGFSVSYTYGVDPELVRDSTGQYHVDMGVGQEGKWYFRFEGYTAAGDPYGAVERVFEVRNSYFH